MQQTHYKKPTIKSELYKVFTAQTSPVPIVAIFRNNTQCYAITRTYQSMSVTISLECNQDLQLNMKFKKQYR